MQISYTGRHFDIMQPLKEYFEEKLQRLDRYSRILDVHVIMEVEQRFSHTVDITVHAGHMVFHARESSENMYASIDLALGNLDEQLRRTKEKIKGHKVSKNRKIEAEDVPDVDAVPAETLREVDALQKLELNKDLQFLLFRNAETQKQEIVFKGPAGAEFFHIKSDTVEDSVPDYQLLRYDIRDSVLPRGNLYVADLRSYEIDEIPVHEAAKRIGKNNPFFVPFINTHSKRLNLVYQRANGNFAVVG